MTTDTYTTNYSSHNNSSTSTFHGLVFAFDFNTDYPRSNKLPSWAERIASDMAFEKQLKKNEEARDKNKDKGDR